MGHADEQRLIKKFVDLTAIDSMSLQERKMADTLKSELEELGFDVTEDKAAGILGAAAGNLYGYLKGNMEGSRPVLFSAHMDTVGPGYGKKARGYHGVHVLIRGYRIRHSDDSKSRLIGLHRFTREYNIAAAIPRDCGHVHINLCTKLGAGIYRNGYPAARCGFNGLFELLAHFVPRMSLRIYMTDNQLILPAAFCNSQN